MPKRVYQPKKAKRQKKHGFRSKNRHRSGKNLLKRRRLKGRKKLTV